MGRRSKPRPIPKSEFRRAQLSRMERLKIREKQLVRDLKRLRIDIQQQHLRDVEERRINEIRKRIGLTVKDFKMREKIEQQKRILRKAKLKAAREKEALKKDLLKSIPL